MKYQLLTSEYSDETDEFKFAATLSDDTSLIYSFENCGFKEIDGVTQLESQIVILEKNENSELVAIKPKDYRYETALKNANELLKQFIFDLTEKLKIDIDMLESEVA